MPRVLKSDAPLHTKIEAWYHLTANLSYPLMIMLSVLLLPAMIIRFYQGWFQMLYIDLPAVHGFDIFDFELLPGIAARTVSAKLAPGVAVLAVSDGAGDWIDNHEYQGGDGSADRQAERIRPHAEIPRRNEEGKVGATKYRKRLGWVPWLELLIGTYFAVTVYYAIDNENYITVPFLFLFVVGYWYTGLMSLLQGRFRAFCGPDDYHTKPFPVGV